MKKFVLTYLALMLFTASGALASHLMGGEVLWECVKTGPNTGRFIFTVKLYRDCNGIPGPNSVSLTTNAPGWGGGIACPKISQTDISPTGPGCPTCVTPLGYLNAVEEFVYRSAPILITGVPPATGWFFYYTDCCRNGGITNLTNPGSRSFTLRAIMYPYNATNTNPCYDSSPQFAERPQLSTCTRNQTDYNHNAVDQELDSLVYDWGVPLDNGWPGTPIAYTAGYTSTSPLPSAFHNPANVAATLNQQTGVVSFTSFTPGAFVTVTKVTAYKCNVKVAEIFREIQIALLNNCIITNGPPVTYNTPPDVQDLFGNPLNVIIDTVVAGDTIEIDLIALDFEALPATVGGGPQSLSLSATGSQFGTNFTNSSAGCFNPPCATLDPPWIDTIPPITTQFNPLTLQTKFRWITDCNHLPSNLGCVNLSSTYNFVLKVYDNFCPSPAVNFNTLTIVVVAPPPVQAARFKCLDVQDNGSVQLTFLPPRDIGTVDTNKFFKAFYIYRSLAGPGGPYTLLDSLKGFKITNYDTVLTYLDNTATPNAGPVSYYITTRSGCNLLPPTVSDTLSTIYLQVNQVGTNASLTWTPLNLPTLHPSTSGVYDVYREQPPAGSGNWVLIGSTPGLSYLDPVFVCNDSVRYRVAVRDTLVSMCMSRSNIDGDSLQSAVPSITSPSLRSTEVLANGDVALCWVGSIDTAQYFANYKIYHSLNRGGPYTNIGSVTNYAANTFTHVGANANNVINYYYLTLTAGCDATNLDESDNAPSDTLASIRLNTSNATLGFADLVWNPLRRPLPATSTGFYVVNRRIPPGAWTVIGNTVDTTYRDTIILCDTLIQYRVDIGDNSACFSRSSVDQDNFTSLGEIIANPQLRCLAVQPNGDVTITWLAPPDPNSFFAACQIYSATNPAGPYTLVGTVNNYATTTWTHTGANANTAIRYYYLRSLSGCDGTRFNATSDTLATMLLNVSNANLGFADLSWNAMRTPQLASAPGPYRIMRRPTGVGGYTQIGTTFNRTFRDTITNCNIPFEYRIELDDNAPCVSISSADNDVFTYIGNIIGNPILRCVDVQANGNIVLNWELPSSASFANFNEYEIWRNSGAGFIRLDSVSNAAQNSYTDITANGNAQAYSYYLVTQSGCTGQLTNGSVGNTLSSIFLTTTGVLGQANLNWTALSTPLPATTTGGQYNVYNTYNPTGAMSLIGDTVQLVYNHPILHCDTTLSHQIRVDDNIGCSSRSNITTGNFTWLGNVVGNPDLRCVSVLPNGQIQLTWIAPAGSNNEFNEYEIWRNNGAGFVLHDSVGVFGQTTWTDNTANGNNQSYGYYMRSQSGCTGQINSPANSATVNSIYVTTTGILGQATINWNSHPLLPTSLPTGYDVWSSYPTGNTLTVIAQTAALSANETITDCDTTLLHRVSVNDNSGCISWSNVDTNTFTFLGNVINSPDLRCVNVLPSGQIQLTWISPSGSSAEFNEYEIWRNNGAGFVLVDSVSNFGQTTWTDINANGNNQSYGYYMRTQSGCSGQVNSPTNSATVNSIYVTTTGVLGQATINWNSHPILPTSVATGYDVWSSYPTGNSLSVIASTSGLSANEVISDCDTTLLHRVSLTDLSGCVSNSNIDTNNFTYIGNIINNPDLRCVSVLPNGQIQLTWITPTGSSDDFNEYEIWKNSGAGFVLVDSVPNFAQTTWTDVNANGNNQSYGYYMRTQSGCTGQENSPANSATLNSIFVTTTGTLGQATINWNSHPILPTSVATGYDVWSSYPNGNSLSVITSTTSLSANEPISNCDTTLLHRVSLTDQSGCTSFSNIDTNTFTYLGNVIDHPELRCASVLPNGQVQLTWVNPSPASWADFNQYNLWRNTGAGFVLIDSIENNLTSTYTDVTANGNLGSVAYYLQTKSGCTGQTDPSATGGQAVGNTLRTIYLTVTGGNTTTANLNWNPVSTPLLPTSTGSYTVEKEFPGGIGTWTVAANLSGTNWQENLILCIDTVNYRILIGDDAGCVSVSNIDGDEFVDHTVPDAPSPRCASVNASGSVTLTWVAPVDTGMRFGSYTLYRSASLAGPYTPVTVINNYNTLTYTDATVNAQNASFYYTITTKTACGGEESPYSDTLRTIKVNVVNNNGVAIITWNPLRNPELPTATGSYKVFKEYPTGSWNQIGTATAPVYQWADTINVCEAVINYRVETGDAIGCVSVSSIDGDLFRDVTRPNVSLIDTASINPFSPADVSVSWLPSSSGDVIGYIIYQFNGASWDSVGAVTGINASYFLHNNPAAAFASQLYSIAAFDSCGNVSNLGATHNTLFITAKLDVCRAAIDIRWNPYINMVNGVSQYRIFVSENGGPYSLLASVPGNNISYSHTGLTDETSYCYYIQAVGNTSTRTASSNEACEYADLLELPTFSYLKRATVIDQRKVLVECLVDTAGNPDVSRYKLQRAFEPNGPFVTVTTVNYTGQPIVSFIDNGARTNQYSYYYRVITIDSCGNEVLISNLGRTILLTGLPEFNLINELRWNEYIDWLGGVSNYTLFRSVDGIWDPAPLVTVNDGVYEYNDEVSELYKFPNYRGEFCYRVEAYEGAGNPYGFTDTSSSNIFCLIQEPHVFVPNAFTPGGKNNIFKPDFIYVDTKNYFFAVFNRWGQKVYETRVPGDGWDGTFNGSIAPEGTYAYTVRIFGTNGREIEKVGTVTLLR